MSAWLRFTAICLWIVCATVLTWQVMTPAVVASEALYTCNLGDPCTNNTQCYGTCPPVRGKVRENESEQVGQASRRVIRPVIVSSAVGDRIQLQTPKYDSVIRIT